MFLPRQLNIKMLDRCNAACSFCGYNRDRLPVRIAVGHKAYQLDVNRLVARFPALRAKGIGILHLTGGEPTLHPDFVRLVREAKAAGFSVRTGTNGSMLDEERVRLLAEARVDYLWYSLDTFPFEDHLRHRGFSHIRARMEQGLEHLRRHRVNVFAQTVLSRVLPWKGGLPDLRGHMAYYRRAFGFGRFVFSYPMHQEGDSNHLAREGGDAVDFTRAELAAMIRHLLELKALPEGRDIVNPRLSLRAQLRELEGASPGDPPGRVECRAGRDIFFLGEDEETLRPCYHLSSTVVDRLDGAALRPDNRFRDCTACRDQCFRDPSLVYEAARAPWRFSRRTFATATDRGDLARDAWDFVRHGGYARAPRPEPFLEV
jgi:MoaA/NifB/PqqE/SkfB family radical SAM enzyme